MKIDYLKDTEWVPDVQNSFTNASVSVAITNAARHRRELGSCNSNTTSTGLSLGSTFAFAVTVASYNFLFINR